MNRANVNDVPSPIVFTTSRFGSLGRLHWLCQLYRLGGSNSAFSILNLGYDESKRRKFAVFSECPGMNAGPIAPVFADSDTRQAAERLAK
jgi:hypothetical protein